MRIGIVGCGFVADQYIKTLAMHPQLELVGVTDKNADRLARFCSHYNLTAYASIDILLNDGNPELVVNLTNPRAHYEITRRCLNEGKHVYSEKPLAMNIDDANELVDLAAAKGLQLSSAPCSMLSEAAQTMWKALREKRIGKVFVAYAEMDDGLVHRYQYHKWKSESGTSWPYKDEFEVGCTLEHAGYCLTWLCAFFGPAESVTAFSSTQIEDKETDEFLSPNAPDFSCAMIQFESGVVARLTCSIIAPHDHRIMIVGDEGALFTKDSWLYRSPVYIRKWIHIRRRTLLSPWKTRVKMEGRHLPLIKYGGASHMDFCRGIAEMAEAIKENKTPRLSADFSLHITELSLAISNAMQDSSTHHMQSTFEPVAPMPWAK